MTTRPNSAAAATANTKSKADKTKVVVSFRIFVVLRPPPPSQRGGQPSYAFAGASRRRRSLAMATRSFAAATAAADGCGGFTGSGGGGGGGDDDDRVIRDDDADDEADEIWDRHALAVIPLDMTVPLVTATVGDVLQAVWPYFVELWRNEGGRCWPPDAVPQPLPSCGTWFSLRMLSSRWRDVSRADMRACVEPQVAAVLAGMRSESFRALPASLATAAFDERGLRSTTKIKALLPGDPVALEQQRGGGKGAASSSSSSPSSLFLGRRRGAARGEDAASAASLPHYRLNLLFTLSTPYLLQEHIACCEAKTRQAIAATVNDFLLQMKDIERANIDLAQRRQQHRERVDLLFVALMDAETRKRQRLADEESWAYVSKISAPCASTAARLLPVFAASQEIQVAWRERLSADMQRAREDMIIEAHLARGQQ